MHDTCKIQLQAAIICGDQDTYVEFLYPSNGIQWLQGDQGESGLPDIRAQAGFVAEDGRFFTVTGSGTDNVSVSFKYVVRHTPLFRSTVVCRKLNCLFNEEQTHLHALKSYHLNSLEINSNLGQISKCIIKQWKAWQLDFPCWSFWL